MSRVGKLPVAIPQGVDVSITAESIQVKGSGGMLSAVANPLVKVESQDGKLSFVPADESREANAMSGTLRQLVSNMVIGVSKGFEKKLSLIGVGYDRSTWENGIKGAPAGKKFYRTITDDTQPGGPVERTIEYLAPFDRCDREQDYETAWRFFEEKYGRM